EPPLHRHYYYESHGGHYLPAASTCAQERFPPRAQTARPGASRSSSAKSPPCLRPVPTPSGRWRRDACLPRKGSETFPAVLLPFPVPEQFFPVAGGILQT